LAKPGVDPSGAIINASYSVQVDGGEPIELSRDKGRWVADLALDVPHLVVIRSRGQRVTSFRFRFPDDGTPELCLFLTPFYATWQVWPDDRCPWCKCESST
jgi:hypothetical protein